LAATSTEFLIAEEVAVGWPIDDRIRGKDRHAI
jgi:hypothetical protein